MQPRDFGDPKYPLSHHYDTYDVILTGSFFTSFWFILFKMMFTNDFFILISKVIEDL